MSPSFFHILLFVGLLLPKLLGGQELLRTIPLPSARFMTTDELGNVYVVTTDNALLRFNDKGDSTGSFRSIQNGDLLWVDATNPLRILLSYPQFSKVILLDNMLAPKHELDLKKMQVYNMPAAGMSADGQLWVYDYNESKLRKFNEQLEQTAASNDLRMEAGEVPLPQSLLEQGGRVYLCDTAKGIFTLDRFGNYLSTLSLRGVAKLQVLGSQLLYFDGMQIQVYDTKSLQAGTLLLPLKEGLLDARVARGHLLLLYADQLEIYRQN